MYCKTREKVVSQLQATNQRRVNKQKKKILIFLKKQIYSVGDGYFISNIWIHCAWHCQYYVEWCHF